MQELAGGVARVESRWKSAACEFYKLSTGSAGKTKTPPSVTSEQQERAVNPPSPSADPLPLRCSYPSLSLSILCCRLWLHFFAARRRRLRRHLRNLCAFWHSIAQSPLGSCSRSSKGTEGSEGNSLAGLVKSLSENRKR